MAHALESRGKARGCGQLISRACRVVSVPSSWRATTAFVCGLVQRLSEQFFSDVCFSKVKSLQVMQVGNLRSMFAKRKAFVLESQEVLSSPEEEGALAWSVDVQPAATPRLFDARASVAPPPALLSKQEQKFYNRCKDLLKNMEGLELQHHQAKLMELKTYYEEIQKKGRVLFVPGNNAEIKARLGDAALAIVRATSSNARQISRLASDDADGSA